VVLCRNYAPVVVGKGLRVDKKCVEILVLKEIQEVLEQADVPLGEAMDRSEDKNTERMNVYSSRPRYKKTCRD
jgi:hypothetical protein